MVRVLGSVVYGAFGSVWDTDYGVNVLDFKVHSESRFCCGIIVGFEQNIVGDFGDLFFDWSEFS